MKYILRLFCIFFVSHILQSVLSCAPEKSKSEELKRNVGILELNCPDNPSGTSNPLACESGPLVEEIFGPEKYTRELGKPVTVTSEVEIPFDGDFCFSIVNGEREPPDGKRISSAVVTVNGDVVVGTEEFNQNVELIQKIVTLEKGSHNLGVELRSKPGSYVSLSIRGIPEHIADIHKRFPDYKIVTEFQRTFPYSEREVSCFKLLDPETTQIGAICLDVDNECLDLEEAYQAEANARFDAVGVMDKILSEWVFGNSPDVHTIGITYQIDFEEFNPPLLDRPEEPASDEEVWDWRLDNMRIMAFNLDRIREPIIERLEDDGVLVVDSSNVAPVFFARMTRDDVLRYYKDVEAFSALTISTDKYENKAPDPHIIASESVEFRAFYQEGFFGEGVTAAVVENGEVYDGSFIPNVTRVRADEIHPHPLSPSDERHATFVAGCLSSFNLLRVSGAPLASIVSANWFQYYWRTEYIIEAVDWAIRSAEADVLNCSFGKTCSEQLCDGTSLTYFIDYMANLYGVTFVKASGNEAEYDYEADCPGYGPICVGAYDDSNTTWRSDPPPNPIRHTEDDKWAYFSNHKENTWAPDRKFPHVVAPGLGIGSTREDDNNLEDYFCTAAEIQDTNHYCNGYINRCPVDPEPCSSGTSFAAPFVSALVTLMMEYDEYSIGFNLKMWPQLVHSIVIASATNDVDCDLFYGEAPPNCSTWIYEKSDYDGFGGINGMDAKNLMDNGYVDVRTIEKVDDGEDISIYSVELEAGTTVRAVLTWMEELRGVLDVFGELLSIDMDLLMFGPGPGGQLLKESATQMDNHEIIEYQVTETNTYYFVVRNTVWRTSLEHKVIALAIHTFPTDENTHPR